jgi:hypothetical protein
MEKAVTDINVRKELYKKYKIDDAE